MLRAKACEAVTRAGDAKSLNDAQRSHIYLSRFYTLLIAFVSNSPLYTGLKKMRHQLLTSSLAH